MSLDYQLGKIKDWKTACFRRDGDGARINVVTEMLIHSTMMVDLGGIDAKNLDEWEWRLEFLQQIGHGDQIVETKKVSARKTTAVQRTFTRAELEAHVGLSTNVIDKTRKQFMKRWVEAVERDVTRTLRDRFLERANGHG